MASKWQPSLALQEGCRKILILEPMMAVEVET
jgi:hypothetical protein